MAVIWVDAHADINTPSQTPSGNIHGMPVSFLLKELRPKLAGLPSIDCITPVLDKSRLAYIGLRSVDDPEWENIRNLGITYFTMRDIDKLGIDKVVTKVLDSVNRK
ncbi:Amino-acid acetyltransferase, mitochondrial [Cichlidogyrus casuarinus]|uniref:Amino-acid acetyltransferase, mitochondrial n=1 Tax=Cichlidogyrus casuarinus TaxID=1844966 RepID=A0ABD2Q3V1_9PLAT